MFPIFFNYEKTTQQYIYTEQYAVYRMSLTMMLKFKSYLRENLPKEASPIEKWYSTLQHEELEQVIVKPIN